MIVEGNRSKPMPESGESMEGLVAFRLPALFFLLSERIKTEFKFQIILKITNNNKL